ncbi:MAG: ATP-dependent DNA helicase RecG [Cellvibrionales bacterium]|nr:ATP-dependent DNA helicase RecG [Cellvibrionales bacterium]
MPLELTSDIRFLKGVGPKMAEKFHTIGIQTVLDLLFHLPRDYQDRTRITPIRECQVGRYAQIEGAILQTQVTFGKRRSLLVTVEDLSGKITLRFFHFNKQQQANMEKGRQIRAFAECRLLNQGMEMIHPEYSLDPDPINTVNEKLTAIYSTTQGISQTLWRNLQTQAIAVLENSTEQVDSIQLPKHLKDLQISLNEALMFCHNPPPTVKVDQLLEGKHPYQMRLALDELIAHQLSLLTYRHQRRSQASSALATEDNPLLNALPFQLTNAQARVVDEIANDLNQSHPMMRLVQGDVGSGKTIIAAIAACFALTSGFQAVLMAPTEILAEQHLVSFTEWFTPLGFTVESLLGKHTKKQKRERLEALKAGDIQCLIGTHAVIEDDVQFHQLGLIIIDEQHRFGVHQRLKLHNKGQADLLPHQLIMTATPIPRTLAMTAYADLDLSIIDELPKGRQPIITKLVDQHRRNDVIERIHKACLDGQQAYWVCTLIEESETLNCQTAEDTFTQLQQALPNLQIGLVHGRLKPTEKALIMEAFANGDIHLLVATTVIEVGVNVPNAAIMVIENPERLGLSQLHQLRGRVGRGHLQSYCLLVYQKPLSSQGKERLQIMRESNDGFVIAEKDMALRGPGEILGDKQTGLINFRVAHLERDNHLVEDARTIALSLEQDSATAKALIARWLHQPEIFMNG